MSTPSPSYEPPQAQGTDPTLPDPTDSPGETTPGPDQPPPVAPEPSAPPAPPPPRPARLAVFPIVIGLFGLVVASGIVMNLTDGAAAGMLFLLWMAVGLFAIVRLAKIWQDALNARPPLRRQ